MAVAPSRKTLRAPVINALRKEVDSQANRIPEIGKKSAGAIFPAAITIFKRSKWVFGEATDEAIALLIARKVYWQTKVSWRPGLAGIRPRRFLWRTQ